jgi:hypothetical protein
MRRRVASAASERPVAPVGHTAGGAASYSAEQRRRGPRTARGPSWASGRRRLAENAALCRSCGVADVVHQVGPSCTAHGSSVLVKAHTSRRRRPSCSNTGFETRQGRNQLPTRESSGRSNHHRSYSHLLLKGHHLAAGVHTICDKLNTIDKLNTTSNANFAVEKSVRCYQSCVY